MRLYWLQRLAPKRLVDRGVSSPLQIQALWNHALLVDILQLSFYHAAYHVLFRNLLLIRFNKLRLLEIGGGRCVTLSEGFLKYLKLRIFVNLALHLIIIIIIYNNLMLAVSLQLSRFLSFEGFLLFAIVVWKLLIYKLLNIKSVRIVGKVVFLIIRF